MTTATATRGAPETHTLLDDVSVVLSDVRSTVGPTADETVARLEAELRQPLTIAVAGRTNTGKSTLVNALIGNRLAPTGKKECTRAVTWFRYGPDQPQVVCRDGRVIDWWFTEQGQLPVELPVPPPQVQRVDVCLQYEPLRTVTVIDTPGLSSDEDLANQTRRLLDDGHADVLLFVFGGILRDDDRRLVSDFRSRSQWLYDFPANAHGVVSHADRFEGADGPWAKAQQVAAQHAALLASELAGVLPVMGKLAETTDTGALTEKHADWLNAVAALSDDERDSALSWPAAFARHNVLTQAARSALLERLDIYGIKELTSREHKNSSAAGMYDALRAVSGMAALRRRIDILFMRPAAVHKAVRILGDLEAFVRSVTHPGEAQQMLLNRIEDIRLSPAMHTLSELRALAALYSGRCDLGDALVTRRALQLFEETDPVLRLEVYSDPPADIATAAAGAARYWKSFANFAADTLIRFVAETAATSAYLLHRRIRSRP
jgi:energy-coupling factor transporter ATP-binding protein EcfA2